MLILIVTVGVSIHYFSQDNDNDLILATTTSVDNSGLLGVIIQEFEKRYDINVRIVAKGSGAAVDLAKRGEADAILLHAPNLEKEFMDGGYGLNKTSLWYNFFVIVGPSNDPANISMASSVQVVFEQIRSSGELGLSQFYSRGDNSGTHLKELEIWENTSVGKPSSSDWYFETGSGMSSTLIIADESNAYTLSDLGTFLQINENSDLRISVLYDNDDTLRNPYSFIVVSPEKFDNLNTEAAFTFLEFLLEEGTMELVGNYKVADMVLFTPEP
ncbi:MAG: tungsten ABC transporter substrate-binding protein [Candidatus Heimdallarchaeota archaeon]|nr:tungsten ABC transporter substrate-binding protein [Candidatus Heimdallarchaeota archaeon]